MERQKILVVRNDKLGDFMLAWPTFALIKRYWPEIHITAMVPEYTAPVARLCPWINEILIDHNEGIWALSKNIRNGRFDALLTLFSTGRVALAALFAGIPYRLAPSTKIAQLFYSHRLVQRRSHSKKPEYLYNLELAHQLLKDFSKIEPDESLTISDNDLMPAEIKRPLLSFDDDITELRKKFIDLNNLSKKSKLIFIHPGSGGSANNLSIEQFSALAMELSKRSSQEITFVITAGPGEEEPAQDLVAKIAANYPAIYFQSDSGIAGFAHALQIADLFISGSTGTLHIAGAMNCNTAGFYPRHRSAIPLRWQTLNSPERRLAFTPPDGAVENNLSTVDIDSAAISIIERFL
ncbi:MAG: glycosyltransferase family 9 protein [Chromatiales bacterium]|nr:glycosyltransferase family 9 protein [Chromatiales bacterium]